MSSTAPRVAFVVVLLLAALAGSARAAETTVTFDDLPANTTVSNQYAARGVTFGPSVAGQRQSTAGLPVIASVGTAAAASGSQVGRVQRVCFALQCTGTGETWAQFSSGQTRVRVSVGAFGTAANTISLTAFDASGAQVATASASASGGTFRTVLTVFTPTAQIRFVRIRGSTLGTFGIDNLFFSNTVGTTAEFSVSAPFGTHAVQQGSTIAIPVTLTRRNSSGAIRLSVSGLPPGASVAPVDSSLAAPSPTASSTTVNLQLSASSTAPPATDRDVTIVATPLAASAGTGTRTQIVRMRLVVLYDLRVTGIEVSQGIQRYASTVPVSAGVARYTGVPLQYNGRTVVRVYANTPRGGVNVSGVGARLFGFDAGGSPLPGSPLFPDQGTLTVPAGTTTAPTRAEQTSPRSAWTFTLPLSWTGFGRPSASNPFTQTFFATRLRAEISIPAAILSFRECDGCAGNDALTLNDVSYNPTCCVTVASALITATGGSSPRPIETILQTGVNVTPLEMEVPPYGTTIDLSSALERAPDGRLVLNRQQVFAALAGFKQRQASDVAIGIIPKEYPDASAQLGLAFFDDRPDRSLTSSGRELGHALGRPNASPSCGGAGEAWPPDETGLIGGIALDRSAPSPYRLFATPAALDARPSPLPTAPDGGDLQAFYDLLSLCASEPNAWISTKGWTDTIGRWPSGNLTSQETVTAALVVNAGSDAGGAVSITSVRPLVPAPLAGLESTPYRLVVRDSAGAAIADVPMLGSQQSTGTFLTATAAIDPSLAAGVEVTRDGAVAARRARSPRPPTAEFLSPGRGVLVGSGKRLQIRWRAADADGDALDATVEWSARGGRPGTWRTVFIGGNGGAVGLPSDYFGGSDNAFLRLRVSDGFNETVVRSAPFRTIHRPPRVAITSPRPGARSRRDATLVLQASARDEAQRQIAGRRLTWTDGRRRLGRGESVAVRALSPGLHRIQVVATDVNGRRAAASLPVRIVAVAPELTRLDAPRRLPRRARSLTLRVATTLPARLVVTGGARAVRARVDQRGAHIRVPVLPVPDPLALSLALSADGRTRSVAVGVERS